MTRTMIALFCLVLLALLTSTAWVIAAHNWHARSLGLAALVVLGAVSVYLLGSAARRPFGH
jgi:hypothetical protein